MEKSREEEEADVKLIIKSVLGSSATQMNLRDLHRFYAEMTGQRIPFQKFGYRTSEEYLRSIPDTLVVYGTGPNATVTPKLSQHSEHIVQMIARQKTQPRRGRPPMRRPTTIIVPANQTQRTSNNRKLNRNQNNAQQHATNGNNRSFSPEYYQQQNVQNLQSPRHTNTAITQNEPKESCEVATKFDYRTNYRVPFIVQENLLNLMAAFPDGIWLRKLPEEYRKMYNSELEFTRYGYAQLVQMCCALDTIFQFKQMRNDDLKLYDARLDVPEEEELINVVEELKPVIEEVAIVKALPDGFTPTNTKYPEFVMLPGDTIPIEERPELQSELYIPVMIAEVYDVSKFWFNLASSDKKLDLLHENIEKFYNDKYLQYRISPHQLVRGLFCVVYSRTEYQRAVIVKFTDSQLKVFCVDTGTVMCTTLENVFFLHRQFTDLPRQGLRGRLYALTPTSPQSQWCRKAAYRFLELVRDKIVYAGIAAKDISQGDLIYEMYICDSTHAEDIIIQETLIAEGLATATDQEQKVGYQEGASYDDYVAIVDDLYLYPTFIELENAAVPTASEMIRLVVLRIPLYEIYPIYFNLKKSENLLRKNLVTYIREKAHNQQQSVLPATEDEEEPTRKYHSPLSVPPSWSWSDVKPLPPRPPPGFQPGPAGLMQPPLPPMLSGPMPPMPLPMLNYPPNAAPFGNWPPPYMPPNYFDYQHLNYPAPYFQELTNPFPWMMQQNMQQRQQLPGYNAYTSSMLSDAAALLSTKRNPYRGHENVQRGQRDTVFQRESRLPQKTNGNLPVLDATPTHDAQKVKKTKKKYVISTVLNEKKIYVVRIMSMPCIIPDQIKKEFSSKMELVNLRRYLIMSDIVISQLQLDIVNDELKSELIRHELISDTQPMLEYTSFSCLEELVACIINDEYEIPGFDQILATFSENSPLWDVDDLEPVNK